LYGEVGVFSLIFGCLFIAPFGGLNLKWGLDTIVSKTKTRGGAT